MLNKEKLNQSTIYQVFVRNYSKEGTFKKVEEDLDRIKDLGADIVYLTPIHIIGEKNRKGSWGSPYAAKDYYSISPDLGTLDDFKSLINKVHEKGMKIIIDMVFNHTAPDSVILEQHPDYYYRKDGQLGNRVGDWSDIIDLETSKKEVQEYLSDVLAYWIKVGVDGFRFDVASIIPLSLFKLARTKLGETPIFFAESVDPDFLKYNKHLGYEGIEEVDLYPTFDTAYCYNTFQYINKYLTKEIDSIVPYVEALNNQEATFPKGYNKSTSLENHDQERLAGKIKNEMALKNVVAFSILNKGMAFIYAGEEYHADKTPNLFEKDPIDKTIKDQSYYDFIKHLIHIKKGEDFLHYTDIKYTALDKDTIEFKFNHNPQYIGVFNMNGVKHNITLENGTYHDLISNKDICVKDNRLEIEMPLLLIKK